MKINNVNINNWEPPGAAWWDSVEAKPDEPLIEATISFTLSHREYHRLLDMEERKQPAASDSAYMGGVLIDEGVSRAINPGP